MLDLMIRGGTRRRRHGRARAARADVGIRDGRIVAIGDVDEQATRTIDADGLVVAPGFVDIHTHYDAQVFWDTTLHAVAAARRHDGDRRQLRLHDRAARGPSTATTSCACWPASRACRSSRSPQGVPWDWRSFGEYLDRLDGTLARERRASSSATPRSAAS